MLDTNHVTCSAVPALLAANDSSERQQVIVRNYGTAEIYLGGSATVTAGLGLQVAASTSPPNSLQECVVHLDSDERLYGVTSGANVVVVHVLRQGLSR